MKDNKKNNNWLLDFSSDFSSQKGEDGILSKIIDVIGEKSKWCVEFGAWDGRHLSNTYNLMVNKKWKGVFIESDLDRYKELTKTYDSNKDAICLNKMIKFEGENTLDKILSETGIPVNFDVLSIDIDGNDYHIWDSLKLYSPNIVIIEFNPTIPTHIEFVQPKNMKINQGSSLLSLVNLGKSKGYELISCTQLNAFFVKKYYFDLFDIEDNSPETLFTNKRYISSIFQLYDGTIVIHGFDKLGWHGLSLKNRLFQPLPSFFRIFPENMGPIRKLLFKVYRKIYNKF